MYLHEYTPCMTKDDSTPKNIAYVSTREAAEILGVSYYRVYEYIETKRLPATLVGHMYMLPREAVEQFKPNPTGRVRKKPPSWRKYRGGSMLLATEIRVKVHAGQQTRLLEKLQAIQEGNRHAFTGSIQRYVIEGDALLTTAIISLIWKDIEMPDEATRQRELAEFKQELADVLDWDSATESTNRVLIHT